MKRLYRQIFRCIIPALAIQTADATTPYPLLAPYAVDATTGLPLTQASPGELIIVYVTGPFPEYPNFVVINPTYASTNQWAAPGAGGITNTITFSSVSGGAVDLSQNSGLTFENNGTFTSYAITTLPFSWTSYTTVPGMSPGEIYIKVNQPSKKPGAALLTLKMSAAFTNNDTGDTYSLNGPGGGGAIFNGVNWVISGGTVLPVPSAYQKTATFTLPVSQDPALEVAATSYTSDAENNAILHPGEGAYYTFTTSANSATMTNVSFKATIPRGTTLIAGSIFPSSGVQNGSTVSWLSAGDQTEFRCGFNVKCASSPGASAAVTQFGGAARIENYARSKSGSNKIPIETFSKGQIDYHSAQGEDGPVAVDQDCTYEVSNWDWSAGDVDVSINGAPIGTASEGKTSGAFTVPVFTNSDLESTLSAVQTGKPADRIVTGIKASTVEWVSGSAVMVDGSGNIARTLTRGGKVAAGEVVTTATASSNQLGHLRLDGGDSAVSLLYPPQPGGGSDVRLIFARGGDVSVYGGVLASAITAGEAGTVTYKTPESLASKLLSYNTSTNPGVVNESSAFLSGTTTLSGYVYGSQSITVAGNVTLTGAICYFAGDLTITGSVTGTGTIICIGNLTVAHGATLQFQGSGSVTLGVGGTLVIAP